MKLKVNHATIDYTQKMGDFTAAATVFNISTEGIFIGSTKPLSKIYIELDAREETTEIVVESWNGSAFTPIDFVIDETFGLVQSGFISWPESIDQEKTDYDSTGKKYWIKLTANSNPEEVSIHGINLVLSNDADLSFVPNISDFLPDNSTSFIAFHQEARDIIVQMLRNSGKNISHYDSETLIETRQVEVFDLLDIEEFRNASKYLALHLIFDHISKSDEDTYFQKSQRYYERFLGSYNSNLVSIDTNSNGKTDTIENLAVQFIRIIRG